MVSMRVLLALVVTLGAVLLPTPAHASPVLDEATSPYDTAVHKSAVVTCPNGKVVGMGGRTSDSDGSVVLTGVIVDPTLSSVTAIGRARPGFNGPWSVTASVVCGNPAQFDPERVVVVGGQGTATAGCPGSKILYSSGYLIPLPNGTQYVDRVVPSSGLTQLTVHAGTTGIGPVTVAAYAICGTRFPDFVRLEATTDRDSTTPKTATVAAGPIPGVGWVFGAGAIVDSPRPAFINALGFNPGLEGAKVRAAIAKTYPASRFIAGVDEDEDDWDTTVYGALIGTWYS